MPLVKTVFVTLLAASAMFSAWAWGTDSPKDLRFPSAATQSLNNGFLKRLNNERIVAIQQWFVEGEEEKTLVCVFRAFDKDSDYDGPGVKLSILDPSGASIYERRFSEVQRVYPTTALRGVSSEMVVEVSYGGSTSFLHMLAYRDGKVVELIDDKEGEFEVGAEVRPQFRSGIIPASEPFQILLTHGVGLASPAMKYTSVHRYKDGKYQLIGEFSQKEVDDYMEERLKGLNRPKVNK